MLFGKVTHRGTHANLERKIDQFPGCDRSRDADTQRELDAERSHFSEPAREGLRVEAELVNHVAGMWLFQPQGLKQLDIGDLRVTFWIARNADRFEAVIKARQGLEELDSRRIVA